VGQAVQLLAARFRRAAAAGLDKPDDTGFYAGHAKACTQLANELTHIRRLGDAAFGDFDPAEVKAGRKHLAETNRQEAQKIAESLGYPSMDALVADGSL
jgi:hypothetical protein